jgi:hypothetical protein
MTTARHLPATGASFGARADAAGGTAPAAARRPRIGFLGVG